MDAHPFPAETPSAAGGFGRALAAELRADGPLFALVGAYALAAGLVGLWAGVPERYAPFLYVPLWLLGLVFACVFYVMLWEVPRAARRDPARPLAGALRAAAALPRARLAAGALLFVAVAVFYGCFTSVKTMLPAIAPFAHDRALADLDAALHGGVDPWVLLEPALGHPLVTRAVEVLYSATWGLLLYLVPAVVAMHPVLAAVRLRFFAVFFGVWVIGGNLLALAGMSAGPAYFGALTGDAARFQPLLAELALGKGSLHSAASYQAYLWRLYSEGSTEFASGISAFPSLHVAMATLYVCLASRFGRAVTLLAGLFWLVILSGSVHLAWHYAVDGYAATALTLLLWAAAAPLTRSGGADLPSIGALHRGAGH